MIEDNILKTERLRLERMALHASDREIVGDVGFRQCPNPFLSATTVVGIDPNANDTINIENYTEVYSGLLSDFVKERGPDYFDALLAGELIEHVENPSEFLRECFQALKPGGRVIISTPNPNSFIERILTLMLNRRYFYTSEHVMLIPQRWLIRIMENSGFSNVRLFSGGFPFPFLGLIPFPRPWCYQTIAIGEKRIENSN